MDEKLTPKQHLIKSRNTIAPMMEAIAKAQDAAVFEFDTMVWAVADRTKKLINGFLALMDNDNYIAAAPIVRLNLDTFMVFSGAWLVESPDAYATKILSGKQTNKIKDRNGESMTDGHLCRELSKLDGFSWVSDVYKKTCSFVHFSKEHYFAPIKNINNDGSVKIEIGGGREITNAEKDEMLEAMSAITDGILQRMYGWLKTKERPIETVNNLT